MTFYHADVRTTVRVCARACASEKYSGVCVRMCMRICVCACVCVRVQQLQVVHGHPWLASPKQIQLPQHGLLSLLSPPAAPVTLIPEGPPTYTLPVSLDCRSNSFAISKTGVASTQCIKWYRHVSRRAAGAERRWMMGAGVCRNVTHTMGHSFQGMCIRMDIDCTTSPGGVGCRGVLLGAWGSGVLSGCKVRPAVN